MQFREIFGAADFVGMTEADHHASVLYRSSFDTEKPLHASLTIVGLGVFEAYLNGRPVSEDKYMPLNTDSCPRTIHLRGDPNNLFKEVMAHRLYCPMYDVTALLEEGENVLAVMTGPGWFSYNEKYIPPFGNSVSASF